MALLRGREGSIGEVVSAKLALAQAEYERLRVQARRMQRCPPAHACLAGKTQVKPFGQSIDEGRLAKLAPSYAEYMRLHDVTGAG